MMSSGRPSDVVINLFIAFFYYENSAFIKFDHFDVFIYCFNVIIKLFLSCPIFPHSCRIFHRDILEAGFKYGFGIEGQWLSEHVPGKDCMYYKTVNGHKVITRLIVCNYGVDSPTTNTLLYNNCYMQLSRANGKRALVFK